MWCGLSVEGATAPLKLSTKTTPAVFIRIRGTHRQPPSVHYDLKRDHLGFTQRVSGDLEGFRARVKRRLTRRSSIAKLGHMRPFQRAYLSIADLAPLEDVGGGLKRGGYPNLGETTRVS